MGTSLYLLQVQMSLVVLFLRRDQITRNYIFAQCLKLLRKQANQADSDFSPPYDEQIMTRTFLRYGPPSHAKDFCPELDLNSRSKACHKRGQRLSCKTLRVSLDPESCRREPWPIHISEKPISMLSFG